MPLPKSFPIYLDILQCRPVQNSRLKDKSILEIGAQIDISLVS